MKKVIGIFRGFPGLGRVVAGVSLLETLRDKYNYDVRFISYLQGNEYLKLHGCLVTQEPTKMDYCSIGLLPTNRMGNYIHRLIRSFNPDYILIDGEPLILQSIRLSHPEIKVITLLNPSDVDNPQNDAEAMDYFNALYSLSDLAIVHGLRKIEPDKRYSNLISINTILRNEIINVNNTPTKNIYCVLGGGTINVDNKFVNSTIRIGELCIDVAAFLPDYTMHILCSSKNIFDALKFNNVPSNIRIYEHMMPAENYYANASLIITRSGRNSLSELAYVGVPTIAFTSGCEYRKLEQKKNIQDLNTKSIIAVPSDIAPFELAKKCIGLIGIRAENQFKCGNDEALKSILEL
jgi:hypothetical protein